MRNQRQLKADRAVLDALSNVPDRFMLPEDTLRADAARAVVPPATTAELDEAIAHLDRERRILRLPGETCIRCKITDVGRAWLAENP